MLAHAVDASESSQPRQGVRGLVIATFAFVTVFAASAVPIPLYSEYKGAIGLTDADISATMLMYLFGVVATGLGEALVMYVLGLPLLSALKRFNVVKKAAA